MKSFRPLKRSPWLLPTVPSYTTGIVAVVVLVVGQDGTLTLGSDGRISEVLLHGGFWLDCCLPCQEREASGWV
jgi:hypothetical protein